VEEVMMNKKELVRAIANNAGITLKDAEIALDSVITAITDGLNAGEKIQISGFGTFELKSKGNRDGINPKTGEKIKIGETRLPAFKFGKAYKDSFN
jgi:DNA-binding protein HU-beta